MNFNDYTPVKVSCGEGIIAQSASAFSARGTKALIVTGKHSAALSGALPDITAVLESVNIAYTIYDGIGQNPLISACHEAGQTAREIEADFIIGVGGGSPMDAAKAAAIYASNPALAPIALFDLNWEHRPLPLILVGTTAGTGSEVTAVSVLTVDETMRKRSITHNDCYASLSFADPLYTHSMTRDITISTALDALSHAAEGWFSPKRTDMAASAARNALPLIFNGLRVLDSNGPLSAPLRESLYYGSLWAGVVLSVTGTGFPHPFGYALTEDYNIPHGKACTAFLPALVERARQYERKRFDEFFHILQCDYEGFNALVRRLTAVELTIPISDADQYLQRWVGLKNFANTPGGYNTALAKELLYDRFHIV